MRFFGLKVSSKDGAVAINATPEDRVRITSVSFLWNSFNGLFNSVEVVNLNFVVLNV